jgi:hypothetical protein
MMFRTKAARIYPLRHAASSKIAMHEVYVIAVLIITESRGKTLSEDAREHGSASPRFDAHSTRDSFLSVLYRYRRKIGVGALTKGAAAHASSLFLWVGDPRLIRRVPGSLPRSDGLSSLFDGTKSAFEKIERCLALRAVVHRGMKAIRECRRLCCVQYPSARVDGPKAGNPATVWALI